MRGDNHNMNNNNNKSNLHHGEDKGSSRGGGLALHRKWLSFRVLEGRSQARAQPDQLNQRPVAHAALAVVVAVVVVGCGLNDMPFKGSVHLRGIAQAGFCVIAAAMYGVHMLMAYAQSAVRSCVEERVGGGPYSVWGAGRQRVHHACDDNDDDDDDDDGDYDNDDAYGHHNNTHCDYDNNEEEADDGDTKNDNHGRISASHVINDEEEGGVGDDDDDRERAAEGVEEEEMMVAVAEETSASIPLLLHGGEPHSGSAAAAPTTPNHHHHNHNHNHDRRRTPTTAPTTARQQQRGDNGVGLPREVVISSMYLGGLTTSV
jgi:hypothetical protein